MGRQDHGYPFGQQVNEAWKANLTHYKHAKQGHTLVRTPEYTVSNELHEAILNVHPFTVFHGIQPALPIRQGPMAEEEPIERRLSNQGCNPNQITIECIGNLYGTNSYKPVPKEGTQDALVLGYAGQYVSQDDLDKFMQEERPDSAGHKVNIQTADGATNDPSSPRTDAVLDVEMVVGVSGLNTTFLSYTVPSFRRTLTSSRIALNWY